MLLNDTILDSMVQRNDRVIIKNFTEAGIKILGADFAFAWWKFSDDNKYKLAYKSPTTPYQPFYPRKGASHYTALHTKKVFFDTNVKKQKYGKSDISSYMKSFIIIPITHGEYLYGTITICYKNQHQFTEEELSLSETIGNSTAQAITVHRLIKRELERNKRELLLKETEALLSQEKSKTEFITNAAHELRTPLAIIKGNIDLATLAKDRNQKSSKAALSAIDREVKHLSGILSDLIMIISPTKQLKSKIEYEKLNLKKLVSYTVERCSVLARKKHISLVAKSIPNITISGSRVHLEKLFINLIANSILYGNARGKTTISAKQSKQNVLIEVSDNGIGIPKSDLSRIFERFYRIDKSHNSGESGTGLGLYIVKWIAEAHGGTVQAKSIEGKGSTFTVTLPIDHGA